MFPRFRRALQLVLVVTVGAAAQVGHAQSLATLSLGTRVQLVLKDTLRQAPLTSGRQVIAGTLVRVTTDSVWLRLNGVAPFGVTRTAITSARASRGVSRLRSAVTFGLGIGLAATALELGYEGERRSVLAMGGVGLGVGAVIGAISPFETWRRLRR